MEGFEISKTPIEIPITFRGKKQVFKMRELTSDDIWEINKQTQSISKEGILSIDQPMRNKLCLTKSLVEPSFTIESVGALPHPLSQILIDEFNKLHYINEDDLKKTTSK